MPTMCKSLAQVFTLQDSLQILDIEEIPGFLGSAQHHEIAADNAYYLIIEGVDARNIRFHLIQASNQPSAIVVRQGVGPISGGRSFDALLSAPPPALSVLPLQSSPGALAP